MSGGPDADTLVGEMCLAEQDSRKRGKRYGITG